MVIKRAKKIFNRALQLFEQYERRISTIALVTGFVVDNLTLRRVDLLIEEIALISYLAIAGGGIALLNIYGAGKVRWKFYERLHLFVPTIIQFALGGLFSGFVVFYSRSGSISASWPFLLILVALLVGNEVFRDRYHRQTFQTSVLFFATFSFMIFFVPVLLREIGPLVFLLSGLASVALILAYIAVLARATRGRFTRSVRPTLFAICGIYAAINMLYFLNVIPPIPLTLTDGGVYRTVERLEGGYSAIPLSSNSCLLCFHERVFAPQGEVYAYSAVFAPTRLDTTIVHDWQRFDESKGRWVTESRIPFRIVGGRDGGYRGYSVKSNVTPGQWRVDVETARGQVIGRIRFEVERGNPPTIPDVVIRL